MAQIFTDEMGHEVYVSYVSNQWEPKGSLLARSRRRLDADTHLRWAHGWCERCRREVQAPADEAQPDLFETEGEAR